MLTAARCPVARRVLHTLPFMNSGSVSAMESMAVFLVFSLGDFVQTLAKQKWL